MLLQRPLFYTMNELDAFASFQVYNNNMPDYTYNQT
jgi:hypothetical protein